MCDLIYSYGMERFSVKERGKKEAKTIPPKSRRQQEIMLLVKERRNLRKQWKKSSPEERAAINVLQADLKERLGKLRRAENIRTRRKKKERARTSFYKDPFRFMKALFTKEKSGSLKVSKKELEDHLKKTHTDRQRYEQRVIPPDMPPISQPEHQLDDSPPRWSEVEKTVRKARAASAPGPNGVPYRLYKNAPEVLRFLLRQMKVVWKKQTIPKNMAKSRGSANP